MPAPKSGRALVTGSGTVSVTNRVATFSADQSLKRGAIIRGNTNQFWFTVIGGSGKKWRVEQIGTMTSQAFTTNDPSTTRAKHSPQWGGLPAGAKLFLYFAPYDQNGDPDFYTYFDSLYPEKGVHPYTRDQWTGGVLLTTYPQDAINNATPEMLQDPSVRLRFLEGRVSALDSSPSISDALMGDPWASR